MARPALNVIGSGAAAWEADIDDNFSIITETPFPLYWVASSGSLPSASSYADCLAMVGTAGSSRLWHSNGSSWSQYDPEAAYVADSTATDVAGLVSDLNDLLSALQTAGIMATS